MAYLARELPMPIEVSQISSRKPTEPEVSPQPTPDILLPHVCVRTDCAARKVIETTELLENILSFIPTRQILPLQWTNKKWMALVRESPALRLHLFVEPNWQLPSHGFELLPFATSGLLIKRADPVHLGQWVEVHVSLEAATNISQGLGYLRGSLGPSTVVVDDPLSRRHERVALLTPQPSDLLVSQPPLTNMQAFVVSSDTMQSSDGGSEKGDNGENSQQVPIAHSKIACDAGITLGFVADVAKKLLSDNESSLESGSEEVKHVVFKSIMSFCSQSDAAPRRRSNNRWLSTIE